MPGPDILRTLTSKKRPRAVPVTERDLLALAGCAVFAGILFAPLRHYAGSPLAVRRKKVERDSFPVSTYPMFSADRNGKVTVPHVIGLTATGQRRPLHYRHYGTGGLNQVRKQIARAIRHGAADDVAQRYADSLAASKRAKDRQIVTVVVVRSRFRFADYFDQHTPDTTPLRETQHARCEVGGRAELLEEHTA